MSSLEPEQQALPDRTVRLVAVVVDQTGEQLRLDGRNYTRVFLSQHRPWDWAPRPGVYVKARKAKYSHAICPLQHVLSNLRFIPMAWAW